MCRHFCAFLFTEAAVFNIAAILNSNGNDGMSRKYETLFNIYLGLYIIASVLYILKQSLSQGHVCCVIQFSNKYFTK